MRRSDANLMWQGALLAAVGIASFLLFAPSFPDPRDVARQMLARDVAAHAAVFALLGFALARAFRDRPRLILFEFLVLAAGFSEMAQYLIPGRDPAWADLGGSLVGACAALLPRGAPRTEPE